MRLLKMLPWVKPPFNNGNQGGDRLPTYLATEPLVGYRTWRVLASIWQPTIALHSLHMGYEWIPGRNEARCMGQIAHNDPAPSIKCACGLYAQLPDHPLSEWESMVRGRVRATGMVALSGRIIQCERGYKASQADIQSPLVLEVDCEGGGHRCDEPVVKIMLGKQNSIRDFYGACREHSEGEWFGEPPVMVEAAVWLRNAGRSLKQRYRLDVLNWLEV